MKRKFLYIPMELVVRELDGKTLIATKAAEQGWTSVVAAKIPLFNSLKTLPEGVFLLKSATPNEEETIKKIKEFGHKVIVLDEEGLVDQEKSLESNVRYNSKTVDLVDRICFWGKKQYEGFKKSLPNHSHKAVLTGNPRSDIWRYYAKKIYENDIVDLQKKYGDFVFIPTSFGGAIHRMGNEFGIGLTFELGKDSIDDYMKKLLTVQGELLMLNFKEYYEFIKIMVEKFPHINFILRPHPSESHAPWNALALKYNNVYLKYEGSVTPWILASSAMMHYRSTTSLEAYLMDKIVFTYVPRMPEYFRIADLILPETVSYVTETRNHTLKLVRSIVDKKIEKKTCDTDLIDDWIFEDGVKSSSEHILKEIEDICPEPSRDFDLVRTSRFIELKQLLKRLLINFFETKFIKTFMPKSILIRSLSEEYGRHKEIGFDLEVIKRITSVCSNNSCRVSKFHPLMVKIEKN